MLLSYISRYKYNFIHFVYDNNQIRANVSYEITLLPLYTDCIQIIYYDHVHTASHLLKSWRSENHTPPPHYYWLNQSK